MHVVVAGATGATGRSVVEQARAAGHRVTALVRDASAYEPPAGVTVQQAQVVTDDELELAPDADVVITSLGKRAFRDPVPVCAAGTANLLGAMARGGVRRIVGVSAVPVLTTGAGEPWWFRHGLRPFVRRLGRELYADLAQMEDLIRNADFPCEWTIVRPGRLTDDDATDYRLVEEANATTAVSRADLAHALVTLAGDPSGIGRSYGVERGRRVRSTTERVAA